MLPPVLQDVHESETNLPRSFERAGMVAVAPDAPASSESPVDGLGYADCQPLNSASQRVTVLCLDEQVHVILLHREVQESEVRA
jgi:hypothetical protein